MRLTPSATVLEGLSPQGRILLDRGMSCAAVATAATVLYKGSRVSGAYVVTRGLLRVYSIAPGGAEATLYFLNPGETCVLALNCLFQDLLYPAWVTSEMPTEVAIIPGPVYRRLFEREPAVQNLTVRALSTAVFHLMDQLEQVHFHKLEHRLADFLLRHACSEGTLRTTQRAIACHLGTTREVIARLLGGFAAEGLVETRRGLIRINRPAALAELLTQDGGNSAQPPA